jgi:hypothetical protein
MGAREEAFACDGRFLALNWSKQIAYTITPKSGLDANRALTNDLPNGFLKRDHWLAARLGSPNGTLDGNRRWIAVTKRNETIEKREERLREAAEAMAEYQARERGLSEQMARQKALRLAQADRHPLEPAKQPRKIVVRRRAAA